MRQGKKNCLNFSRGQGSPIFSGRRYVTKVCRKIAGRAEMLSNLGSAMRKIQGKCALHVDAKSTSTTRKSSTLLSSKRCPCFRGMWKCLSRVTPSLRKVLGGEKNHHTSVRKRMISIWMEMENNKESSEEENVIKSRSRPDNVARAWWEFHSVSFRLTLRD